MERGRPDFLIWSMYVTKHKPSSIMVHHTLTTEPCWLTTAPLWDVEHIMMRTPCVAHMRGAGSVFGCWSLITNILVNMGIHCLSCLCLEHIGLDNSAALVNFMHNIPNVSFVLMATFVDVFYKWEVREHYSMLTEHFVNMKTTTVWT